ncbi:YafY family protein [Blastococcus sp. Marseille-P5729]|uniref:helix-turn-helix transcriptional regulator n=1 Tax=Blastococcus sp. Marseille-P5729 TaxID=2086582 RepID=UPI000D10C91B|nr:YafY family protein [Blastococcus sp. Marseille-P5729]
MATTTGRTLELLGLLQARRLWSARELCERLEIGERTLRRDIDDLRGLGYGIESVPGPGGGYRSGPGASIPPLVLSGDEAVAIAVGLRAAAAASVAGIEQAAASALEKLERSLSAPTRRRIETIDRAMVTLAGGGEVGVDVMDSVAHAIRESRRLRAYYRRHDGVGSSRTLEPHRIVHSGRHWYLYAWDVERADWRTLRLDRLAPKVPLGEVFTPRQVPDEVLRSLVGHAISSAPYPYVCRVRVHAPVDAVASAFGPTVASVSDLGDGMTELVAGANNLAEFVLYLGASGMEFDVVEPTELREVMKAAAARLMRAAAS